MQLFPHQIKGVEFLSASEGTKGLFFGMGTGKTLTSIYAAKAVGAKRVLVIAPPIALPMWRDELEKHMGRMAVILKTGKTKLIDGDNVCHVVSYAIAAKRSAELRDWLQGGVLICDESHALKSVSSKRTVAVMGRGGIATGASYSWMLTGTPITRWNDDVYPFLCRADLDGMKARCGGAQEDRFQLRYTIRQKREIRYVRGGRTRTLIKHMVVGNQNTAELGEWIYGEGHALRVDLKEVFESMPPLTTNRYDIPLDGDAAFKAAMKALEKATMAELRQKLESKEPALATLRRQLGLAKVKAAAAEIAERIESGQNVLVGAWHTDVIDELEAELEGKGYECAVIDGRCTAAQKQSAQDDWNAGEVQALICQIAAAGVSLNLQQGGNQIVVVEEDWSPSIMDQFYARLWRYGQEKHVHVDILTSATKLDKALARIADTKERQHAKFNAIGREVSEAT